MIQSETCACVVAQCVTTSVSLFTDCQPFLKVLSDNGGSLTGTTIMGLLTVAQNTTADSVWVTNSNCRCSPKLQDRLLAWGLIQLTGMHKADWLPPGRSHIEPFSSIARDTVNWAICLLMQVSDRNIELPESGEVLVSILILICKTAYFLVWGSLLERPTWLLFWKLWSGKHEFCSIFWGCCLAMPRTNEVWRFAQIHTALLLSWPSDLCETLRDWSWAFPAVLY